MIDLHKISYNKIKQDEAVVFTTYASLIGKGARGSRLDQLVEWCGPNFAGCLLFDECHKAKNLVMKGSAEGTATGRAVLEIQRLLPKARVVYCSATGVSEPENLAYMERLGLWGPRTHYRDMYCAETGRTLNAFTVFSEALNVQVGQ